MKIKFKELIFSKDSLKKLGEAELLDGQTIYKIACNLKKIEEEYEKFDYVRGKLVEKYGEKQDDNIIRVTDQSKKDLFNKELNKLLETERDVDILLISPNSLRGIKAIELIPLFWMLELEK